MSSQLRIAVYAVVAVLTLPGVARAADEGARTGRVLAVRGAAFVTSAAWEAPVPVERGMTVRAGSTLETQPASAVQLRLGDGSVLNVGPAAKLTFSNFDLQGSKQRKASFKLIVGKLWARVTSFMGAESSFEVSTNNAVAGVRGTEFIVSITVEGESNVVVVHGSVSVTDQDGKNGQLLGELMAATVAGGTITVRKVTPAEVADLESDLAVTAQVNRNDLERLGLLGPDGKPLPRDRREAPGPQDPTLPRSTRNGPPLVPGTGRADVRGSVEVRDDPHP
jgi:ferric-dicitrate binding protein FerR (iron transport regulator)